MRSQQETRARWLLLRRSAENFRSMKASRLEAPKSKWRNKPAADAIHKILFIIDLSCWLSS